MVGPRGAPAGREDAGDARRARCSRSRTCTCSTTAGSRRFAASRSPFMRARSSASRASTATARRELIEAITGLRGTTSGRIKVAGRDITGSTTREILDAGVGHIPEDRQRRGLVLEFTLAENFALHDFDRPPNSRFGWLMPGQLFERAVKLVKEFDVRGGGPRTPAGSLSGGNQQKVVVAREVERRPTRADRRAADARPRRRRDRVRPPSPRRGARRGAGGPARLARAGRDPVALRPDPRHVRGSRSSASTRRTLPRRSSASRCSAARRDEVAA